MPINPKWNLQNIPPEKHDDVADFAFNLFDIARQEKERVGVNKDFLSNYALYRGRHGTPGQQRTQAFTPVNLYFANVERTVAAITANNPVGEVIDLDGISGNLVDPTTVTDENPEGSIDNAEDVLSAKLISWQNDIGHEKKTVASARQMEIYGITPEHPIWDKDMRRPDIQVLDPFTFLPAPGNWDEMDVDAPYVCLVSLDYVDAVEKKFNVTGVAHDEAYPLLGTEREEYKAKNYGTTQRIGNYEDPVTITREKGTDKNLERCLVIEVYLRDTRQKMVRTDLLDDDGKPILDDEGKAKEYIVKQNVYPDTIRKISIVQAKDEGDKKTKKKTRSAYMVIDDSPNPNINPELEIELAMTTHPWGRLPIYYANSYQDLVSIWGFAAAEQVGDLVKKITQIFSKLIAYVINVLTPPLIISANAGITKEMIETGLQGEGRLILQPATPNARVEFMEVPNLPATFFQVLELIIKFFDRIYAFEEADRGKAPGKVIAGVAIAQLQERNRDMLKPKTSSVESLVENRAKWFIGLSQNFGWQKGEFVKVKDEPVEFIGSNYAGRRFSYTVEAGSTTPRTKLQIQELAMKLYMEGKAVTRRYLLETLNMPGWKEEVERMGEGMLDQALQALIDAGLDEAYALELKQFLMEPQGGPGDTKQTGEGKGPPPPALPTVGAAQGATVARTESR